MDWVARALRQSHRDERKYHDEAISRLMAEHARLHGRLDAMYIDKLDGRADAEFHDRKAAKWRAEKRRLLVEVAAYQDANEGHLDNGAKLLELAQQAHSLFRKQVPSEQRRLLDFVVSNCSWKDGRLTVTYRQPFDILAETTRADRELVAAGASPEARNGIGSPSSARIRTLAQRRRLDNISL